MSNDDGTTSSRTYYVYRPPGLAASQTNRPPAMLTLGGAAGACTEGFRSDLEALAAMERFVIVELTCVGNNWRKEWVNSSGRTTPDDEPYVKAVVNDITACPASPAANQCMDSVRIYADGGGSGGNMVADLMCDGGTGSTTNDSTLFRGYLIDSGSLQLYSGNPDCPSTNTSYFAMLALSNEGADNGLYYDSLPNPHFDVDQTGTHFQYWLKAKLGCTSSQTYDSPWSPVRRYRFSGPCTFALGGDAVESLGVINGGHTWTCQDSDLTWTPANQCTETLSPVGLGSDGRPQTGGLWVEKEFWRFVDVGVSP